MPPQPETHSIHGARWLHRECGACGASFRLRRGLRDARIECPFCDAPTVASGDEPPQADAFETAKSPVVAGPPAPNPHPPSAGIPARQGASARTPIQRPATGSAPAEIQLPPREPLPATAPPRFTRVGRKLPEAGVRHCDTMEREPAQRAPRKASAGPNLAKYVVGASLLLCAAAIVTGLLALFRAGNPARGTEMRVAEDPPPAPGPPPPVAGGNILRETDCQAALEAVRQCFGADSVEAMLPFVRQPDEVRPLMEVWYRARPHVPLELGELVRARLMEVNGGVRLLVLDIKDAGGKSGYYVVEHTPDSGMKVDWEVSARYQEVPLAEFQASRPMRAVPFRVHAMVSDYYNYEYSDSERYLCLELSYPGDPTFKLWGYAERASPVGVRLAALLEFGAVSLILDLCYPQGPQAQSSEQVAITALRHSSWFR